jgi:hypothetical protein
VRSLRARPVHSTPDLFATPKSPTTDTTPFPGGGGDPREVLVRQGGELRTPPCGHQPVSGVIRMEGVRHQFRGLFRSEDGGAVQAVDHVVAAVLQDTHDGGGCVPVVPQRGDPMSVFPAHQDVKRRTVSCSFRFRTSVPDDAVQFARMPAPMVARSSSPSVAGDIRRAGSSNL